MENLTAKRAVKLKELLDCNLRTVRAYLLKEQFHSFWECVSAAWAGKFLEQWCTAAMRSRFEPMKGIDRMLRGHKPLILNWFEAREQVSLGAVEGLNNRFDYRSTLNTRSAPLIWPATVRTVQWSPRLYCRRIAFNACVRPTP